MKELTEQLLDWMKMTADQILAVPIFFPYYVETVGVSVIRGMYNVSMKAGRGDICIADGSRNSHDR
ncbi:hypothetical protein ACFQI7_37130 [Paenibacillus allorhizosphaerae]|uniref:hypothetical protein n=1 Tax=Paenibacillus allorhizosphaerae TaxID=2849866 RepID=UPI001C406957|nr:hypothetical protein [Paenibacillus allorhizosphaerae]